MTPAQLIRLAEIIYAEHGRNWVSPLARDLGVSPRTVNRWLTKVGKRRPLPESIEDDVRAIAARRAPKLEIDAARRAERLNDIAQKE